MTPLCRYLYYLQYAYSMKLRELNNKGARAKTMGQDQQQKQRRRCRSLKSGAASTIISHGATFKASSIFGETRKYLRCNRLSFERYCVTWCYMCAVVLFIYIERLFLKKNEVYLVILVWCFDVQVIDWQCHLGSGPNPRPWVVIRFWFWTWLYHVLSNKIHIWSKVVQ